MPEQLLVEIDALVGKRGRSAFITEATRFELERRQLAQALLESEGSWKDADHPELADASGDYVARLRKEDEASDEERRGGLST